MNHDSSSHPHAPVMPIMLAISCAMMLLIMVNSDHTVCSDVCRCLVATGRDAYHTEVSGIIFTNDLSSSGHEGHNGKRYEQCFQQQSLGIAMVNSQQSETCLQRNATSL